MKTIYKWDLKTNKIFVNKNDLPEEMDRLYSEEKQDKLKWLNKDKYNLR